MKQPELIATVTQVLNDAHEKADKLTAGAYRRAAADVAAWLRANPDESLDDVLAAVPHWRRLKLADLVKLHERNRDSAIAKNRQTNAVSANA